MQISNYFHQYNLIPNHIKRGYMFYLIMSTLEVIKVSQTSYGFKGDNYHNIMYAHNYIKLRKWEITNYTLNVCMCVGGWSYYGFHNLSWASSAKDAIKFWWGWWAIPMASFSWTCWNKNSTVKKGLIMDTAQRQRCSHSSSIEHEAFGSLL